MKESMHFAIISLSTLCATTSTTTSVAINNTSK
jgi:hypothetical protein